MGIGYRLKEARLRKGLTQEALANMVGVTKGAIGNYENETSHPKLEILLALLDALYVDANYVFQDEQKDNHRQSPPERIKISSSDKSEDDELIRLLAERPMLRDVLDILRQLDDESLARFADFVRVLKQAP